jgi:polyisoprenoid-binding protein YceI
MNRLALVALSLTTLAGASAAFFAPAAPATSPIPAAASYTVDGGHSSVVFRIKHQNVAYFYGRFNTITGSFNLDEANPKASMLDISVDTNSVDTNSPDRDKHLKTPDFFSVKEFPTLSFKSTSVESKGDKKYLVKGDLTLHGQSKPVEVTITDTGRGEGRGGTKVAGIETMFVIKRSDYGMSYMMGPLGDEVTIYVSLEGGMK